MTLLEHLERELERVRKQLHQSTRELTVLTEQITRLRTGARPEVVCAALELALGVRAELYLLQGQDGEPRHRDAPPERLAPHPEDGAHHSSRWSS